MDNLIRLKNRVATLSNEPIEEEILTDALESAKYAILAKRYPFHEYPTNEMGEILLPTRYLDLQYRIALEIIAKMGAEGQVHHTENQINRQYADSFVSKQLLNEVVPLVKVVKRSVYTETE